jgi:hypothetical protein
LAAPEHLKALKERADQRACTSSAAGTMVLDRESFQHNLDLRGTAITLRTIAMTAIPLTKSEIDLAIPRVADGLTKYAWLQRNRDMSDLCRNPEYQKRFNNFYRLRRNKPWRDRFYELLENVKGTHPGFGEILEELRRATNCYEASFASKLLATVDENMPVIDSVVLRNLKLRLPPPTSRHRSARIEQLHADLLSEFRRFLATDDGRYLVSKFRAAYPGQAISEIKMLDLVLWQTRKDRSNPSSRRRTSTG